MTGARVQLPQHWQSTSSNQIANTPRATPVLVTLSATPSPLQTTPLCDRPSERYGSTERQQNDVEMQGKSSTIRAINQRCNMQIRNLKLLILRGKSPPDRMLAIPWRCLFLAAFGLKPGCCRCPAWQIVVKVERSVLTKRRCYVMLSTSFVSVLATYISKISCRSFTVIVSNNRQTDCG